MKTVAVTGGIASGKSVVARMMGALGAVVHSSDEDARAVLADGSGTLEAVRAAFPSAARPDGSIDRGALAARIFKDPAERKRLEAIMHPAIRARMDATLTGARKSRQPGTLVYEVPLLFESGLEERFDTTVAVVASPEQQARRLQDRERAAGRSPLSEEEIAARLAAQLPSEEKARRADYVIRTDGSLKDTRAQVVRVWNAIQGTT